MFIGAKRNKNTSVISFCGPDSKTTKISHPWTRNIKQFRGFIHWMQIPKELRCFIGWNDDLETLQTPHTLRHSVPKSSEISDSEHSTKQFCSLKLWTLTTPYPSPAPQQLPPNHTDLVRTEELKNKEISHPATHLRELQKWTHAQDGSDNSYPRTHTPKWLKSSPWSMNSKYLRDLIS